MSHSKLILITGSEGYLGSYLVNFFLTKNYNVIGIDIYKSPVNKNYKYFQLDISIFKNLKILKKYKFNLIIHCAAKLAFERKR